MENGEGGAFYGTTCIVEKKVLSLLFLHEQVAPCSLLPPRRFPPVRAHGNCVQ